MRIKFLSFIASFFMVSFVITSCLDDDNNIEYSPDATIHAFSLDTIGYGITYKFTIDQQEGLIYNEDSLPVHADTIIDKILIKTLTTASGIVTMKDRNGQDSTININDSIDLRESLKIKVWSTEAFVTNPPDITKTKDYTISVRVHKHDPDSLKWNYVGAMQNEIVNEQKTIEFNSKFLTYSKVGEKLKVYQNNSFSNWTAGGVETKGELTDVLPNSIIALGGIIFATANNNVYESTDGITWTVSSKFAGKVNTFVSKLPIKDDTMITYIKTEGEERYFYSMLESKLDETGAETKIEKVDERFPVDNISYTTFSKGKKYQNIIVGKHEPAIEIDINNKKVPVTVTWGYDGSTWAELGATTAIAYCPAFDNPNIIYYNDLFYIFGEKLESIYVSNNEGVAWKKANKKVAFLNHDWSKSNITESTKDNPEFRGRKNYSVVQDVKENFIYILFSKEDGITFTEEVEKEEEETRATEPKDRGPYRHDSEVWRARLNQLWFDLDPQRAGQ